MQVGGSPAPQILPHTGLGFDDGLVSLEEPPFLSKEQRIRSGALVVERDERPNCPQENVERRSELSLERLVGRRGEERLQLDHGPNANVEPGHREIVDAKPVQVPNVQSHAHGSHGLPVRFPGDRGLRLRRARATPRGIANRPGAARFNGHVVWLSLPARPPRPREACGRRHQERYDDEGNEERRRGRLSARCSCDAHTEDRSREGRPDHPDPAVGHGEEDTRRVSRRRFRADDRGETLHVQ